MNIGKFDGGSNDAPADEQHEPAGSVGLDQFSWEVDAADQHPTKGTPQECTALLLADCPARRPNGVVPNRDAAVRKRREAVPMTAPYLNEHTAGI